MQELFANNAITTLASAITSTATTITLATGTGALFPNPSGSQFFRLSLTDSATKTNHEICYCTARSGDTLTVTRNAEQVPNLTFPSSTGSAWSVGDIAENAVTAGMMINTYNASNDQANVVRYGVDTGTANAYLVALNPSLSTPTQAAEVIFKPIYTNTGASTIALNGGTAYAIVAANGSALIGGEIQANQIVKLIFNSNTLTFYIELAANAATTAFNSVTVSTPTQAAQATRKDYVDSGDQLNATWQNMTSSRQIGNGSTHYTYTNTESNYIDISVTPAAVGGITVGIIVGGVSLGAAYSNGLFPLYGRVPPGATYEVYAYGGAPGVNNWAELR